MDEEAGPRVEKRLWLPEFDQKVEEPEEKIDNKDDVTSINIKHQIDAIRYYIMMGYLYKGNFYARVSKLLIIKLK